MNSPPPTQMAIDTNTSVGNKRKAYYGYPRDTKKAKTANSKADQALAAVRRLRRHLKFEKKAVVHNDGLVITNAAVTNIHLSGMAQGIGQAERIGNQISCHSLDYVFHAAKNSSATNSIMRVIIGRWKRQETDNYTNIDSILESTSVFANYRLNSADEWDILYDNMFVLSSTDQTAATRGRVMLRDLAIHYNGANATDIEKNGIFLAYLGSESTNTPYLNYNIKLNYHDS